MPNKTITQSNPATATNVLNDSKELYALPNFNLTEVQLSSISTTAQEQLAEIELKYPISFVPKTQEECNEMMGAFKTIKNILKSAEDQKDNFLSELKIFSNKAKEELKKWEALAEFNTISPLKKKAEFLKVAILKADEIFTKKLAEEMEAKRIELEKTIEEKKEKAVEQLQAVGLDTSDVEDQIDQLLNNKLAEIEQTQIIQPKTVVTASGGVTKVVSYKINLEKSDKLTILKWILEHPEHLSLFTLNEVYANKMFKKTKDNPTPMKVDGLIFDKITNLR